ALSYGLLAARLPKPANHPKGLAAAHILALCKQKTEGLSGPQTKECAGRLLSAERIGSQNQRDATLGTMLDVALIGLGVTTLLAGGLGWVISGRVIKPTEAAAASRKRFIANAAHELRTPLSAMRTALDVTLSKQPAPTEGQLLATAESVSRSVDQATIMVEALLTLSSAEVSPRVRTEVDLAPAAEDALDAAAAAIARRQLNVDADTQPALTSGDRVLIERLVGNLLDNAIRHNVDGGEIVLSTFARDGTAQLVVSNSGPELDGDVIPTLFEPFARGERTGNVEGVGLGLSIAQAIAKSHGATIEAQPRTGGGLEVRVAFPG
ncbi:MAG TPA: HAMP domain-containing sensor histidine kinase, partial [Solirubrobacteraceae bacterium]|nr:HAMP domain-containing sensor histidine kinase [Solirubrobacteraceae bacterium]